MIYNFKLQKRREKIFFDTCIQICLRFTQYFAGKIAEILG